MEYLVIFVIGAAVGGAAGALAVRQIIIERVRSVERELAVHKEEWHHRDATHQSVIQQIRQDAAEKQRTIRESAEGLLKDRQEQWKSRYSELQAAKEREIDIVKQSELKVRTEASEGFKKERVALISQLQDYRSDEDRLKNAFSQLSIKSLDENSARFLGQAQERLMPLLEHQKKLEQEIRELETKREAAYKQLDDQSKTLTFEARQLNRLLSHSSQRGGWGEILLEKVFEMSGLANHIDVNLQPTKDGYIPDAVVRLPRKRDIIVDAKFPLDAYQRAVEAETDAEQQRHLDTHLEAVRSMIKSLGTKKYQSQFESLDFVVMFIPLESAYQAALQHDPTLVDFSSKQKVLFVGPMALLAILRAVAYSWRQIAIIENVAKIGELAEEFHKRLKTFIGHHRSIGKGLHDAVAAYNSANRSFNSRLMPQTRKLEQYVAAEEDDVLKELKDINDGIVDIEQAIDVAESTVSDDADGE